MSSLATSGTAGGKASVAIAATVPFHDLDPMGVMWHGNYYRYFDQARFALFHARGIDLYRYSLAERILFPITRTAAKHIVPLRYGDAFTCRASLVEAVYKIVLAFEIRLTTDGTLCATCRSEQVAVSLPGMEMRFEIPAEIRRALEG
jgi:acyl-CoA thioester hydrolase